MELAQALARALAPAGLDLVAPVSVAAYNAGAPEGWRLPALPLGHVVGATRALWDAFVAALRARPSLLEVAHPLQTFVGQAVAAAARQVLGDAHVLRFAWDRPPDGVAIQRLAEVAGLAFVSPARLAVHPVHGPWISLHAAILGEGPSPPAPPPRPAGLCAGCETRCVPLLEVALAASGEGLAADADAALARGFHEWLAVRDACPVGRASRYGEAQIRYGYTKDRALLAACAARPRRDDPGQA